MKKTIGLTFAVPENTVSLFSNGIRQHVLFLYQLLKYLKYNVYLITSDVLIKGITFVDYDNDKYMVHNAPEFKNIQFDLFLQIGFQMPVSELRRLKSSGCKLIYYKCGNDYVFDMEHVLFSTKPNFQPQYMEHAYEQLFDEVWCNAQMERTNYHYWKTIFRCPVRIVPFIWSPVIVENTCASLTNKGVYFKREDSKKIAIFEPNLNIVKYSMPCVFICENAYRELTDKNKIDKVYITNAQKRTDSSYGKFNVEQLSKFVYALDLYKDNKISVESRFISVVFMVNYADVVVSHQWENGLNFLYLDLAWMGWPVVHNAHFCKDLGYYYDDFNFEDGGRVLQHVIDTHHKIAPEYLQKNRKNIDKFLITNEKVQQEYGRIIESLFV